MDGEPEMGKTKQSLDNNVCNCVCMSMGGYEWVGWGVVCHHEL